MKMSYDSTHAGKHRYTLYLDKVKLVLAGKLEVHSKLLRTGLMGGNATSLNLFITNLLGAVKLVNNKVSGDAVKVFHSASIPGVQDVTCQVTITPSCLGAHLVNITIHSNLYQISDLEVGDLQVFIGDSHVYEDHLPGWDEMKGNVISETLPTIRVINRRENVWEYSVDDIEVIGYTPGPKVHFPVAK
jgi:hypothetical protein